MKKSRLSDPANISPLQNRFFKCMSKRSAAISAYLYQHLNNAQQIKKSTDPYQQMFADSQSPDLIVPALAASIFADLKSCIDKNLNDAFTSGMYYSLKDLGREKPSFAVKNATIEASMRSSYDLIKSAIINLCAKIYSKAHAQPQDLKSEIDKSLKNMLENIALTETMRQKVSGAVQAAKDSGVTKVLVLAEYRTAGDNHVCPQCEAYERKIMSLSDIQDLIPQHPRCRCWFQLIDGDRESGS